MSRKSAKDYRKEYSTAVGKVNAIRARIKKRCLELCKKQPDVLVDDDKTVTAKEFITICGTSQVMKNKAVGIEVYLSVIKKIEDHLASLHPHKQLNMFEKNCSTCRFDGEECTVGTHYAEKGQKAICYKGELWESKTI